MNIKEQHRYKIEIHAMFFLRTQQVNSAQFWAIFEEVLSAKPCPIIF